MANHGRKLPREKIDYIVAQYKRGRSMPSIAEELIISDATVRNHLIDEGVERRPAGSAPLASEEVIDLAAEMHAEGVSWKAIEKKIGLCQSTLSRAIRQRQKEHLLMPAKKFNEKQVAYIVAQYKRGRSSHCIAREMGVTMQTILIYLKEQKVLRRVAGARKMVTLELAELAKQMRENGVPWKRVETKLGVSKETLRVAIIRMNEGKKV